MRPLRLVARGFAAFRDEVTLDFTDTDFFALVGPTGAGKSTVIDAICFALYGSVPRYDDERVVTPVITVDATEARVELDFESAGDQYRIVRIVRRKGQPKVQLDRLAADGTLAESLTSAVREAKQRVTEIVGLSFDQFTKCVVLPQGAFASFLHAGEADRNKLLTSLLDLGVYDRIATLAGERATRTQAEVDADERALADLGAVDAATVAAAKARLLALRALRTELDAARADATTLAEQLDGARAERAATERAVAALGAVEVAPEIVAMATERDELLTRRRDIEAAHNAARAEVERAIAELAGQPSVETMTTIVQAHARLDELGAITERERAELEALNRALADAQSVAAEAEARRARAHEARDACRDEHAAHALATKLAVGDQCPVCEQVVASLDAVEHRAAPAALERAEAELTKSEKAREAARRALATAEQSVTRSTTQLEARDAQRRELLAAVERFPDAGAAATALTGAQSAAGALDDARARAAAAADQEAAARAALDAFDTREASVARRFHEQRDAIAAAGVTGAPVPGGQLAVDWPQLGAWAADAAKEWHGRAVGIEARCDALAAARTEQAEQFRAKAAALAVTASRDASLDDVRDAVREAGIEARVLHDGLVDAQEAATKLGERITAARGDLDVTRALHRHLRTTNFKTWLLGRAVAALAARATERLMELSGGRYELVLAGDGDDFEIIDRNNAGERRPVRSLSGGETFEASLALALALAEQVALLSAAGAASLESIFLDEGFGTLDPEALDLVAGAVETLGGAGRMVGIVTHVGALAERVPVRFRVANDGRTATVVREG